MCFRSLLEVLRFDAIDRRASSRFHRVGARRCAPREPSRGVWTDSFAGAGASLFPDEAVAPLCALGPCTIAIGAFDGFHAGHRALIDAAVRDAHARGMASVAFTFDPDPDVVVSSRPARRLTCASDRHALLAASGVDAVASIPFTRDLASLSFDAFLSIMVCMVCDVRSIHVGSNFRFGRGGTATVADMDAWCSRRGIDVCGHDLVLDDGEPVSSTRIRASLRAGDLAPVERELGRRYLVRGRVQSGRGEGTGMGFRPQTLRWTVRSSFPPRGCTRGSLSCGVRSGPPRSRRCAPDVQRPRAIGIARGQPHWVLRRYL